MSMQNSKGEVFYGMHFYPGVAEYQLPVKGQQKPDPYRVLVNETTIRSMDPSFTGRPVYVQHVDDVEQSLDEMRKNADGYVVESFFNAADGKHWVKFIVVSEKGLRAVRQGHKLSNCYVKKRVSEGGVYSGVTYENEVVEGEYEHLAIVRNPRYDESVIMTPEEFKQYNENQLIELQRFKNSNEKGEESMALNFFKKQKVENSTIDVSMSVQLPKSKREITLETLVNEADEKEMKKGEPQMANMDHHVMVGEDKMSVNELVAKHMLMKDALSSIEGDKGGADESGASEAEDMEKKEAVENKEDEDKAEKKDKDDKAKNAADEAKRLAKEKADKLRNARDAAEDTPAPIIRLSADRAALGKQRYGSGS